MLQPEISVIVVNYNGRAHLERCLPTLVTSAEVAAPAFGVELILVDNGSSDDSLAWVAAHFPQVQVIAAGKNLGFGQANLLGVKAASGHKVAFLNNDTEVAADWLLPLNGALEQQPQTMAVCSQLVLLEHPNIVNALGGGMSRLGYSYDRLFGFSTDHPRVQEFCALSSFPTLFPTAAAMLMRKADFLRLGGFDPAFFMYHEDVDLGWRIWLAGGQVQVCPASVVRHAFGGTTTTLQPSRFRDRMGMRHNLRTMIKCYQPRRLAHALVDLLRLWLQTRQFLSMALILGWNLLHLPGTLVQRWQIQRQRTMDDRAFFESGLMTFGQTPPWGPELPAKQSTGDQPPHPASTGFRLANAEANAMLGCGWYSTEFASRRFPGRLSAPDFLPPCGDLIPVRWTNGLARCRLKTQANATGKVWLRLCTPNQKDDASPWLDLGFPGPAGTRMSERFIFSPKTEWKLLCVTAQADDQGEIELELRSSTHSPERPGLHQEARLMGVGVHDICFQPNHDIDADADEQTTAHAKQPGFLPTMATAVKGVAVQPVAPSGPQNFPATTITLDDADNAAKYPTHSAPEISVIVVNYNGRAHLERCLPTLVTSAEVAAPAFGVELILVDNGSSDDSLAWVAAHFPQVQVIAAGKNLGFGQANLLGVKAASGHKVAFLNNDTEVAADWLLPLNDALEQQPQTMAVCSQLVLLEHPNIVNALGGGMSRLGYSYDRLFGFSTDHPRVQEFCALSSFPTLFPTAAAMLMRKADFLRLGGFDPAFFMYHEDVDLGWRIWLAGGQVQVCPASVVRHAFGGTTTTLQPSRFRDRMGMRHNLRTMIKCYQPRRLAHALVDLLRLWLQTRQFLSMSLILGWNLLHLPGTLVQRWQIQRQRTMDDRAFFESGLMTFGQTPPWGPCLPLPSNATAEPDHIRSPKLCVTDETISRRLGIGWYPVETSRLDAFADGQSEQRLPTCVDPVPVRWTNGLARCRLWLPPNASGQLTISIRTPGIDHRRQTPWVQVICGHPKQPFEQRHWEFGTQSLWTRLQLPAQADDSGLLEVEIRSSTWSPDQSYPSQEARLIGCAVRNLVFEAAEKQESLQPRPTFGPESISVIIPTYNRKSVLLRTLSALINQTISGFEVVVVDDGSTDGTAEAIENWRSQHGELPIAFQLVRQANMKQGVARNHGMQKARGDLILFLGDDITPDADFISEHLRGHQQHNHSGDVAILGITAWDETTVRTTPFLEHVNYEGAQFGYNWLTPASEAPFTCFYTSNISLSREALGVNPFDPRFDVYGWEDCELGLRLCSQGLRIIYHPSARAVHSHQMSLHSFLKRQSQIGESLHTFIAMEPNLLSLPSMGSVSLQRKFGRLGALLKIASPVLNLFDRFSRKPWPSKLYGLLLSIAFGQGVLKGERHH